MHYEDANENDLNINLYLYAANKYKLQIACFVTTVKSVQKSNALIQSNDRKS